MESINFSLGGNKEVLASTALIILVQSQGGQRTSTRIVERRPQYFFKRPRVRSYMNQYLEGLLLSQPNETN